MDPLKNTDNVVVFGLFISKTLQKKKKLMKKRKKRTGSSYSTSNKCLLSQINV